MPFTDYFAAPFEPECYAFERLMQKYEPKIRKTVKRYNNMYKQYLCSADYDDLLQTAYTAFSEANDKFDITKVGPGKNPENVFIAFAARTMEGRLSDYLRKHYKNKSRELYDHDNSAYDIPDEATEPLNMQMLRILKDHLPVLSPREALYIKLSVFYDWNTGQIAEAAHVSEHTVRSWKKSLRKKLAPLSDELKKGK
ncbi:sigma-70 family RNA polymerase sigma factor [Sporolactobacillus shoreicorticis]|uniref:Sigma-70 family RNA polymerase sigma factor n=1 Tax=Sporolactobacillus shoreicorticis TaxID=1923877 RepID=A0ABW5S5B9_9BACL|nr:sigma-70 family RNA polymerase sigma factor [Sporolactobacillus shoreicorticis]MCO7124197.1 sigma-70 family RNA polymerase sigma factor [Sporolactobacillus shoreicorticis]